MQGINFKVSYVPTLPVQGHNPKLTIFGDTIKNFSVRFIDKKTGATFIGNCKTNETIIGQRQWFTEWIIQVFNENGELVYLNEFDPTFKTVFVKLDAYALGDNIAWMPYVEEFRKKYYCTMICSTFWNDLFEDEYPEILFVKPNTEIKNIYTQFYIGANDKENIKYSPITSNNNPLQKIASEILGLPFIEIKPKITIRNSRFENFGPKYVTLSEFGSSPKKSWGNSWQPIVDYLNSKGYKVVVISKEPTQLQNIIDKTGDAPIGERLYDIKHAVFHMGVSSGLSWAAWALGTHTLMVSDCTPHYHEFQSNITRIGTNINGKVDYENFSTTPTEIVLKAVEKLLSD